MRGATREGEGLEEENKRWLHKVQERRAAMWG